MSQPNVLVPRQPLEARPFDVRGLTPAQRDALIVSALEVDGQWVIVSRYEDENWKIVGQATNKQLSEGYADFALLPVAFRPVMKAILYRYMRRGREGKKRPSPRSIVKLLRDSRRFLQYLDRLNIVRLADVTPIVCAAYAQACKEHRQSASATNAGKPVKASTLSHMFAVVEAVYELSQHTEDKMASHPWPGTSATHMAGLTGPGSGRRGGKTPLIPDEVFSTLFQRAWSMVLNGDALLDIRDEMELVKGAEEYPDSQRVEEALKHYLRSQGWVDGIGAFRKSLRDLRTACYIVVASVSGCRNHELALLQSGACYSTVESVGGTVENDETITYWWMRSQSLKTGEGHTEWMVPEAAVTALGVMDRWAKPYQARIEAEIALRHAADPLDPEIEEARQHIKSVFLAATRQKSNEIRTMSGQAWGLRLKAFAKKCGVNWNLATHQFRRKFANYSAHSQFGDLRYLREHFKHWSMDMTLGYALNESQEMGLYIEIQDELDDIKAGLVDSWLQPDELLAGGYGAKIMAWRGEKPVTIFKNHKQMVRALAGSTAIRSNGHAWCTADDDQCVGNDIERTRCSGCENAVIGQRHKRLYQGLYDHLREVLNCEDIGEGGINVVRRDMERCRKVLVSLGHDVEEPLV